jgi:hypothetical protein
LGQTLILLNLARHPVAERPLHCGIFSPSMSELGQKRTSPAYLAMSALPLKADKPQTCWHVRFVPQADIRPTFDKFNGRLANRVSRLYGGRPASRQAFAKGSASAAGSPRPAQNPPALKEGCNDNTCTASAFASSNLPSLIRGATNKL